MFLDNASTQPISSIFKTTILENLDKVFANPSSNHEAGLASRKILEDSKQQIVNYVNKNMKTNFEYFVLTSGSTESINTVFHALSQEQSVFVVTTDYEHKAVFESIKKYEFPCFEIPMKQVFNIKPYEKNNIWIQDLINQIQSHKPSTILFSILTTNNETGDIFDPELLKFAYEYIKTYFSSQNIKILIHLDHTQGFKKVDYKLDVPVQFLTFSGHKIGTFKGIGGLLLSSYGASLVRSKPLIVGGPQQHSLRAGTENPLFVLGLKNVILYEIPAEIDIEKIKDTILRIATELNTTVYFNNLQTHGFKQNPYVLNLSFEGVEGESLLTYLNSSISTTSACNSNDLEGSYVLKSLDIPKNIANCAVRISFNNQMSTNEIVEFLQNEFKNSVQQLSKFRVRKTN